MKPKYPIGSITFDKMEEEYGIIIGYSEHKTQKYKVYWSKAQDIEENDLDASGDITGERFYEVYEV